MAGPPPMGPGPLGGPGGMGGMGGGPGGPPPMGPPGPPPLFGGGPGYPPPMGPPSGGPGGPPPGFPPPPGGMGGGPPPGYPGHHPGHNPGIPPSMAPGGAPLGPPGPPPPMPGAPPAGAFGGPPAAGFAATVAAPTPSPIAAGTNAGPSDGPGFGQASQPGLVSCPRCSAKTPGSFAYCQQCGLHLPAVAPTDPGGAVRAGVIGPGSGGVVASAAAAAVSSSGPSSGVGLGSVGGTASGPGSIERPNERSIDPQGATMAAPTDVRAQLPGKGAASWGTAVLVNRDGSDGDRFPLSGEYVDIGRAGTTITFEQDRFLARTHARLERTGDGARIVCLDLLNGVFRKLELPVDLEDGAVVLVGREVLRYERVADDERDAEPLVQHGVALFGSPPRAPWGRLSELLPSGGVRDVRNLNGEEVVIGREEGDLVFRDDAFMSRRHAAINWDGQRARLTDLGSSNGTFIRLSGAAALRHRDHLRMGDQLFRIELR